MSFSWPSPCWKLKKSSRSASARKKDEPDSPPRRDPRPSFIESTAAARAARGGGAVQREQRETKARADKHGRNQTFRKPRDGGGTAPVAQMSRVLQPPVLQRLLAVL